MVFIRMVASRVAVTSMDDMCTTARSISSAGSVDNLSLLSGLVEGSSQVNASWKLGVLAIAVLHEEDLRLGWVGGDLDDLLLLVFWAFAEHVDEGLLFGGGGHDGAGPRAKVGSTYEHVVVVHLGAGVVGGGMDCLRGALVEEEVSGDYSTGTGAICLPNQSPTTDVLCGGVGRGGSRLVGRGGSRLVGRGGGRLVGTGAICLPNQSLTTDMLVVGRGWGRVDKGRGWGLVVQNSGRGVYITLG